MHQPPADMDQVCENQNRPSNNAQHGPWPVRATDGAPPAFASIEPPTRRDRPRIPVVYGHNSNTT